MLKILSRLAFPCLSLIACGPIKASHALNLAPSGLAVHLKTGEKTSYLAADGKGQIFAKDQHAGEWQRFTLIDTNGGTLMSGDPVHFIAANGRYLSAKNGGGGVLYADAPKGDAWETFLIHKIGGEGAIKLGDKVSLQAAVSRHYVAAEEGGGGPVNVDRTQVAAWECFFLIAAKPLPESRNVKVWLTTSDAKQRLAPQADLSFKAENANVDIPTIDIDDSRPAQYLDGFGASLTESSAWVISRLPPEQRNEVMKMLFHREDGIGLSFMRIPIGSTDFALGSYTYNDTPGNQADPDLQHFSIARDKEYMIPLLKQALQLNPNLKFMASPWSAPAWMKTSNAIHGGQLKADSFAVYAEYLAKVVQTFGAEGLPIHALSLVNEPEHAWHGIPSMHLNAQEAVKLVAYHLGPLFEKKGIKTKIIVWDHNWYPYYPIEVLQNPAANKYIFGSAFHCYGGDVSAQAKVRAAFPDKAILFTECTGTAKDSNFGFNLQWGGSNIIVKTLQNYSRTAMFWNLALDENHGPRNGQGCSNCTGVLTIHSDGHVTKNAEYYVLGHASKFMLPGAHRVASTSSQANEIAHVAVINPDGSHALVLVNPNYQAQNVRIRWKGQSLWYWLPEWGLATLKW